jgi:hypothetical protein
MTEAEWLACDDPTPLLEELKGRASRRKMRLFACACCNRLEVLLTDGANRTAIDLAMRYADGGASEEELEQTSQRVRQAAVVAIASLAYERCGSQEAFEQLPAQAGSDLIQEAANACPVGNALGALGNATWPKLGNASGAARYAVQAILLTTGPAAAQQDRLAQRVLVADIFGNPFRPVVFSPEWRTDTALTLARQMYESREFGAMPILADALQDAGCDNDDILEHCRGDGPHVRGYWVVDLVLGKE